MVPLLDYKAPALSPDEVDGKVLYNLKKADKGSKASNPISLISHRKTAASTQRAASFGGKNREAVKVNSEKSKTPVIGRKSAPAKSKLSAEEVGPLQ